MKATHFHEWMQSNYDACAEQYRRDDETQVKSEDHQQLCTELGGISSSFGRPILVLDAGCGTGRYFHCLRNVEKLVGMDVSPGMLAQAKSPVRHHEAPRQIELICASFYQNTFPSESFDFIYSIGVFGNGCDVTLKVCRNFCQWLKRDGQLFFDAFDSAGLSRTSRARKWLRSSLHRVLSPEIQRKWDERAGWLPFFATSQVRIQRLLLKAGFQQAIINRRFGKVPWGEGWKLQCRALKTRLAAFYSLIVLSLSEGLVVPAQIFLQIV
jgi:SAM-dependent methyltransferase